MFNLNNVLTNLNKGFDSPQREISDHTKPLYQDALENINVEAKP